MKVIVSCLKVDPIHQGVDLKIACRDSHSWCGILPKMRSYRERGKPWPPPYRLIPLSVVRDRRLL